ncbi:MAG: outer membrane lipoprotein-sorting protein [Deltaproteobacteria bacterium]|nr:outer membrane lipoprotein-sorting protein [Deltaproteobacteria bacterium]
MNIKGLGKIVLSVLVVGLFLTSTPSAASALSADEVVEKANLAYYYGGDDGSAKVKMVITSASGKERVRELILLRKDIADGGMQKYYVYFINPPDVSGMVFLVWRKVSGDDDRWLYIPAVDLVKRIATRDKRSAFAGSHFTYEDISGRSTVADTHELIGEEELDGKAVYVIKNTPKDASSVEFSYFKVWIDKATFIPVKGEYYDKSGKLDRTIYTDEIEVIQGIPTVIKGRAVMADGSYTVVTFTDVKYDLGLTEKTFTERTLRKPPRKWLK